MTIAIAAEGSTAPVSFSRDIAPILLKKCVACHGPEKSKGGYRLDTFERLPAGGESKSPAIVPGQPEGSHLYQRVTAADPDDRMPQKDDPLPADQVALLGRWIKEGAKFDGPDPKAALVTLIPRAPRPDPPAVYRRPVPVMALAFSPDGSELAAGGYDEITIWRTADGTLQRRIKNVSQRTQDLVYNPDGAVLAGAGGTPGQLGEVTLVEPRSGLLLRVLGALPDTALAVTYSPGGARLAAAGADNAIRIYESAELAAGKEPLLIQQHADWVMSLAWSPDGSLLASGSRDRTARIYDTKTGELEATYAGHQGPVYAVAFAPNGNLVYSAGRDKKIHIWEAKDGKKSGEIEAAEDDIYRLVALGDSIFSCSADKRVRQHSAGKKELLRIYSGHRDCVYALTIHEGTKRMATGSYDGEVRIWNIDDGQSVITFVAAPGYRSTGQEGASGE